MRTIGVFVCTLAMSACAQLGHDRDDPGPDAGTGSDGASADCERWTTDVVISSAADFTNLPQGCWDLEAALRLSGTGLTTLDKLGGLRKVRELRVEATGLVSLAPTSQLEITGRLQISNNASLTAISNVKPLDAVTSIQI